MEEIHPLAPVQYKKLWRCRDEDFGVLNCYPCGHPGCDCYQLSKAISIEECLPDDEYGEVCREVLVNFCKSKEDWKVAGYDSPDSPLLLRHNEQLKLVELAFAKAYDTQQQTEKYAHESGPAYYTSSGMLLKIGTATSPDCCEAEENQCEVLYCDPLTGKCLKTQLICDPRYASNPKSFLVHGGFITEDDPVDSFVAAFQPDQAHAFFYALNALYTLQLCYLQALFPALSILPRRKDVSADVILQQGFRLSHYDFTNDKSLQFLAVNYKTGVPSAVMQGNNKLAHLDVKNSLISAELNLLENKSINFKDFTVLQKIRSLYAKVTEEAIGLYDNFKENSVSFEERAQEYRTILEEVKKKKASGKTLSQFMNRLMESGVFGENISDFYLIILEAMSQSSVDWLKSAKLLDESVFSALSGMKLVQGYMKKISADFDTPNITSNTLGPLLNYLFTSTGNTEAPGVISAVLFTGLHLIFDYSLPWSTSTLKNLATSLKNLSTPWASLGLVEDSRIMNRLKKAAASQTCLFVAAPGKKMKTGDGGDDLNDIQSAKNEDDENEEEELKRKRQTVAALKEDAEGEGEGEGMIEDEDNPVFLSQPLMEPPDLQPGDYERMRQELTKRAGPFLLPAWHVPELHPFALDAAMMEFVQFLISSGTGVKRGTFEVSVEDMRSLAKNPDLLRQLRHYFNEAFLGNGMNFNLLYWDSYAGFARELIPTPSKTQLAGVLDTLRALPDVRKSIVLNDPADLSEHVKPLARNLLALGIQQLGVKLMEEPPAMAVPYVTNELIGSSSWMTQKTCVTLDGSQIFFVPDFTEPEGDLMRHVDIGQSAMMTWLQLQPKGRICYSRLIVPLARSPPDPSDPEADNYPSNNMLLDQLQAENGLDLMVAFQGDLPYSLIVLASGKRASLGMAQNEANGDEAHTSAFCAVLSEFLIHPAAFGAETAREEEGGNENVSSPPPREVDTYLVERFPRKYCLLGDMKSGYRLEETSILKITSMLHRPAVKSTANDFDFEYLAHTLRTCEVVGVVKGNHLFRGTLQFEGDVTKYVHEEFPLHGVEPMVPSESRYALNSGILGMEGLKSDKWVLAPYDLKQRIFYLMRGNQFLLVELKSKRPPVILDSRHVTITSPKIQVAHVNKTPQGGLALKLSPNTGIKGPVFLQKDQKHLLFEHDIYEIYKEYGALLINKTINSVQQHHGSPIHWYVPANYPFDMFFFDDYGYAHHNTSNSKAMPRISPSKFLHYANE